LDHRLRGRLVGGGIADGVDPAEDEDAGEHRAGDATNDHGLTPVLGGPISYTPTVVLPLALLPASGTAYAGSGVRTIRGHHRPGRPHRGVRGRCGPDGRAVPLAAEVPAGPSGRRPGPQHGADKAGARGPHPDPEGGGGSPSSAAAAL